jgi:glycine/serine hydroxymethyltransferase
MAEIAKIIAHVLKERSDAARAAARAQVRQLCERFPLYEALVGMGLA